ncbi:MAG: glycosyltransferase family 4 protein, partial [Deltaproteobacteria bacterium]|nr:glycosyltransferase family 4 protein [Deltaproteobacteria bacterium]
MQDLLNRKLAIVVNDVTFFLSHRRNIAEAARKAGMQVTICSPAHPQVTEVRSLGFQHHEISLSRWSANPLQEIATVYSLFRAYREIRPDVVHHVTIKPVIYGSLAAKAAKVPAIVNAISGLGQVFTARGTKAALRRAIVKGLYRSALSGSRVRVIFQNRDDRAAFLKSDLVAEYKTTLIRGAGVALDPAAPTQKLPATFSVLFASRLLREKGIEEFVQAAALLRARGLKIRLQVAGEPVPGNPGSISPELFLRWKSEGLIEFLGHRSDMPQLIKDSSVV